MAYGGPIAGDILDGKDRGGSKISKNRFPHEVHLEDLQNVHDHKRNDDGIKHARHNDCDKDGGKWDDDNRDGHSHSHTIHKSIDHDHGYAIGHKKIHFEEVFKTDKNSHGDRLRHNDGRKWDDDDRHQHLKGQKHENNDGKTKTHSYTVRKIINEDDEKDKKHNNDSWCHNKNDEGDRDWHDKPFKQCKDDHSIQHDKNWHDLDIQKDNDRHDHDKKHDSDRGHIEHGDGDFKGVRDSNGKDFNLWKDRDERYVKQGDSNGHGNRNRPADEEAKNRRHFDSDHHDERSNDHKHDERKTHNQGQNTLHKGSNQVGRKQ